jgi:hypothetical protein
MLSIDCMFHLKFFHSNSFINCTTIFQTCTCIIDAAEMDAVDDFLNVMVDLSFIEDREERGRTDIGSVASRRWEAKVSSHL